MKIYLRISIYILCIAIFTIGVADEPRNKSFELVGVVNDDYWFATSEIVVDDTSDGWFETFEERVCKCREYTYYAYGGRDDPYSWGAEWYTIYAINNDTEERINIVGKFYCDEYRGGNVHILPYKNGVLILLEWWSDDAEQYMLTVCQLTNGNNEPEVVSTIDQGDRVIQDLSLYNDDLLIITAHEIYIIDIDNVDKEVLYYSYDEISNYSEYNHILVIGNVVYVSDYSGEITEIDLESGMARNIAEHYCTDEHFLSSYCPYGYIMYDGKLIFYDEERKYTIAYDLQEDERQHLSSDRMCFCPKNSDDFLAKILVEEEFYFGGQAMKYKYYRLGSVGGQIILETFQ